MKGTGIPSAVKEANARRTLSRTSRRILLRTTAFRAIFFRTTTIIATDSAASLCLEYTAIRTAAGVEKRLPERNVSAIRFLPFSETIVIVVRESCGGFSTKNRAKYKISPKENALLTMLI